MSWCELLLFATRARSGVRFFVDRRGDPLQSLHGIQCERVVSSRDELNKSYDRSSGREFVIFLFVDN